MFLKSLTLKGFKSFAESTILEFEPGITVVVGPNGSGKSNIVDAVAWVLGAQGPRTVRSSQMQDVIFAGTSQKPALGRAEVSLTIDNSAGLLPIGFAEVTVTRTLFRSSGESEYALNGVPCRLLDIQELLSDTGVGRQQHVIVSQGQLDSVLNARPEERRLIIEEAAGVLKYRRRREKAQRRLDATEANLVRLQDLLREVRRQLRPLERQADAARRHDSLVAELDALRRFLTGRELGILQGRLAKAGAERSELTATDASLRQALARFDTDVAALEARLTGDRTDGLGDALVRFEAVRERARGVAALLGERQRSVERELTATVDAGVVATLEAEAGRLAAELEEVVAEAAGLAAAAGAVERAEVALAEQQVAFDQQWASGEGSAGQAAEVRGELAALRASLDRGQGERSRVHARLGALEQRDSRLAEEAQRLRAELAAAETSGAALEAGREAAGARVAEAEAAVAGAEEAWRAAHQDHHAAVARMEALTLALDEARARAGAERLADVAGVVGTLLELVEIDDGWEAAFEAAAGEAVAAVVVDGVDAARRALASLHDTGAAGAVLALDAAALPASLALAAASVAAEPVRAHVRGRLPSVDRLLDTLLATAVAVDGGWQDALDLVLAHPGMVAVTRGGDRFAAGGWRAGGGPAVVTGAALEQARAGAVRAEAARADAAAALETARAALTEAARTRSAIERDVDGYAAAAAAAGAALAATEGDERDVRTESDALDAQLAELVDRIEREQARAAELAGLLPALEAEAAAGEERAAALRAARGRLGERVVEVSRQRADHDVRRVTLDRRREELETRRADVERRLVRAGGDRDVAGAQRRRLEAAAVATARLGALVGARLATAEGALGRLRRARDDESTAARTAGDRLEQLRRERAVAERQLAEARERMQRAEVDEAEARVRMEAVVEAARRDFDCEPETLVGSECPELPPGTTAPNRVRELEREVRLMGPVNPLALEEFTALSERHQFLEGQLEDVRSSRRELAKVIRAIDAEIVEVFSAAYTDVADHFEKLFATLFPGGTGRLRLTDPDHMLETGIEVEARPSGKNIRRLSLLSGGERSLTALAFLFAVFRSRPSPFYLLDEVEAALDDVNLHRFLDLIHEFRDEAQLLVVSHQKRTMEAADCLYGVTMQSGGSSKVLSERVPAAP